jgi:iron-sulfur cluster repair protein YtfE (RIC family)
MPSDPFQMAMIHRTFRNEFGNLSSLIRAVEPGDTKRSRTVGDYLDNMISVLHHHHAAEDEVLWPKLHIRISTADAEVERATSEHLGIEDLIVKIQSLRPSWQESADPTLAEQLSNAVEKLSAGANEHFDHEEHNIVPFIAEHITPDEWQTFIDRGAAYVNPRNLWFALAYAGFLLRDATPDERRRFIAALPLPLRMVLKLLGKRAYTAYQTKLYSREVGL